MNALTINRTPEIIASEINTIKDQTRRMMLFNSIEIGRKLIEAKEIVEHGQWGEWLKESVDYSQSTAENLMRIFKEYGSEQISLLNDNTKSQALGNLSYTQALALLGISDEDREAFIESHDIDGMSTRELQQTVKEAQKKAEDKENEAKYILGEKVRIESTLLKTQNELVTEREKTDKLAKELVAAKEAGDSEDVARLENALAETAQKFTEYEQKIKDLEYQLSQPAEPVVVTKIPDEVERELEMLRSRQADTKEVIAFKGFYNTFGEIYNSMAKALKAVEAQDIGLHAKYKAKLIENFGKMADSL